MTKPSQPNEEKTEAVRNVICAIRYSIDNGLSPQEVMNIVDIVNTIYNQ